MKNKLIKISSIFAIVIILASSFVISVSAADGITPDVGLSVTFRLVSQLNSASRVVISAGQFAQVYTSATPVYTYWNYSYMGDDYAYYDSELDMYYVTVAITTNGYIPELKFYDSEGVYIQTTVINEDPNEPLILDPGDRCDIVVEYPATLNSTVTTYTRRLYLYEYNTDAAYNKGYNAGYDAGLSFGKQTGYNEGYDAGLADGLNSSESSSLGANLLGSTLAAPMTALNQFVLITLPNGNTISLGMILGSMIALIVLLAFLKLFAGG